MANDLQYTADGNGNILNKHGRRANPVQSFITNDTIDTNITNTNLPVTFSNTDINTNITNNDLPVTVSNTSFDSNITNTNLNTTTKFDGSVLDGAARLRISYPFTLGDFKTKKADNPLLWNNAGTGTFTYNNDMSGMNMAVTAGQYCVRQTNFVTPYYAGKSQEIEITVNNFKIQTGVLKRFGYYNSSIVAPYTATLDGFYLESDGITDNTYKIVLYNNGNLVSSIPRSQWTDKLDGTGASGINLEQISADVWNNFVVFSFDFLWLGGTSLACAIIINRKKIYFHQYNNSFYNPTLIMRNPDKYIRGEIRSTTGSGDLNLICASVQSEGIGSEIGIPRTIDTDTTAISVSSVGTYYALLGIRLKDGYLDTSALLDNYTVFPTTADDVNFRLILNPTLSATPTYTSVANSGIEYFKGNGTISATGGTVIDAGYTRQQSVTLVNPRNFLRVGAKIDGTKDLLLLAVSPLTSNMSMHGSISFYDIQ